MTSMDSLKNSYRTSNNFHHDPNFEYDLLSENKGNAHHMGRAGAVNSKYDSHIILNPDWGDGWDDLSQAILEFTL